MVSAGPTAGRMTALKTSTLLVLLTCVVLMTDAGNADTVRSTRNILNGNVRLGKTSVRQAFS